MNHFTTFILKIASRCNLDCDYCYMYKLVDQSWVKQPRLMSSDIWCTSATKIADYAKKYDMNSVGINLHGGEPLLLGKQQTREMLSDFALIFDDKKIDVAYGLQTNGTLLDQEWIDLFREFDVRVGISLDGDQRSHDKNRTFHSGDGSYLEVKKGIDLFLSMPENREVFGGILAVIDVEADPVSTLHSLLDQGVQSMDFLFPEANHISIPTGKSYDNDTPYGDWLIKLFDEYLNLNNPKISIRIFEVLIALCLGYQQSIDIYGISPIEILVIETNGELNALDSLKASVPTYLGFNILTDDLDSDSLNASELIEIQTAGYDGLCNECKCCSIVNVCGGGYLPHRYSAERKFNNPSIYCLDLYKLIEHIKTKLLAMKQQSLSSNFV